MHMCGFKKLEKICISYIWEDFVVNIILFQTDVFPCCEIRQLTDSVRVRTLLSQ